METPPTFEPLPEDWQTAYDFGCKAVVNTINAARPVMREQGGGRIVNIVTELWNMAPTGWSVYMAGKGAMVGLRQEVFEHGFTAIDLHADVVHGQSGNFGDLLVAQAFEQQGHDEPVLVG